jgi:hypothetical protein
METVNFTKEEIETIKNCITNILNILEKSAINVIDFSKTKKEFEKIQKILK